MEGNLERDVPGSGRRIPPRPPRAPRRRHRSGWLRRLIWILLFCVGLYFVASWFFAAWFVPPVEVHDGAWVELRFTPEYPESRPDRTGLRGALSPTNLSASDVRLLFDAVARDQRIHGVLLRPDGFPGSWAQVEELVDGIRRLRSRGIEVVAYLDVASNRSYALASACDRVLLAPEGMLLTVGLEARLSYLAGTLEKVGARADFIAVGEYKSAPEQLQREGPSPASREQTTELLDGTWNWWLRTVAQARHLDVPEVLNAIETAPLDAPAAMAAGLVDHAVDLGDWCEERGLDPNSDLLDPLAYLSTEPGRKRGDKVAVVYVDGSIAPGPHGEDPVFGRICGSDDVTERLARARDDASVAAIVLRVDSPGGAASASDAIYRAVRRARARKPVVVSMGGTAASGGYYASMGADEIVADSLTVTGSIGVFTGKLVLAGTYEKLGIHHTTLRSTDNAGLMGDLQPFDDAQRARVRRQLEAFYDRFVQRVADSRQLEIEKARAAAGGRVWSGMRARELGLVDQLGDFRTAVGRAEDLAGLDPGSSRLVDYQPRPGLYERMLHRLFQSALPVGGPAESLRLSELLPRQLLGFDGSVQYRLPWQWEIR